MCYCKNPIFGKNAVPETWSKMISFLYQLYLQHNWRKKRVFFMLMQIYKIYKIIKFFFDMQGRIWAHSLFSHDSNLGSTSRMNWLKKMMFLQPDLNSRKLKVTSMIFGWVFGQK